MTGEYKEVCLILADGKLCDRVKTQLKDHFPLLNVVSVDKAVSCIRKQNVLCLIAHLKDKTGYSPLQLSLFTRQFPIIPVVAIVDGSNFDLILSCAKMGVKEIIADTELGKLKEKIFIISEEQKLRRGEGNKRWIVASNCSPLIKKAIGFMEEKYCEILRVQDIADHLGVKIQTLSAEFSRQCNASLKGLLLFLKIHHAISLMNNPGFKMKDIARFSGFSDYHHFNVCFKRLTGVSPQVFREENMKPDLYRIFREKVKKCIYLKK